MQRETSPDGQNTLTMVQIFWFWVPLAAMNLVMAIENPLITGVIARLPEAKANLAAFGVTFSLSLIIESPIIQLLSATTALAVGKKSYRRLLSFMHVMALCLTGLHLLIALTPLYTVIVGSLMGVPSDLVSMSRRAFLIQTPWAAFIGYRRLYQGILIRYGRTKLIPLTMLARLVSVALVLLAGTRSLFLPGASLGSLSLSVGVIASAAAAYFFAAPVIRGKIPDDREAPSWNGLLKFYVPLALTSVISLIARPILTLGLARAPNPIESLAVWPVVMSFYYLLGSIAISYQEVVIALFHSSERWRVFRRMSLIGAAALVLAFLSISLTPLSSLWFSRVAGLTAELMPFVPTSMLLLSAGPGLSLLISWLRGIQVRRKLTPVISRAMGINCTVLTLFMLGGAKLLRVPGIFTAALAFTASLIAESVYLALSNRRNRNRNEHLAF